MIPFSKRYKYETLKKQLQFESIDKELKNSLWNALVTIYCENPYDCEYGIIYSYSSSPLIEIWRDFLKLPIDSAPSDVPRLRAEIFKEYINNFKWHKVYDLLEFVASIDTDEKRRTKFQNCCDETLKKENAPYRFISGQITSVISKIEIKEVENALSHAGKLQSASQHLENALKSMSNRENPDYPNSIAESIKAVESVCRKILGKDLTLGRAFNEVISSGVVSLDKYFADSLRKMYEFTCDSGGIRHSAKDGNVKPELEDVQFMLVFCSSIVNYLAEKARKAGIEL
jgi:hypothetical protein